ncbi:MAG TPA: sulfite exporter TauE/SafE family protein [Dehalococcoidia bacterium]|nr:sulfite exporter TauE/SafE family protein [Dehalococcoidia bacterium]
MALDLLPLIFLGFAIAVYGTMIGAGGGFILVPVLLLLFPEYGPEKVTAVSLAVVCMNATSGSLAFSRQRTIDYLTGLLFAASAAPGVIAGALLVHFFPERLFAGLFGGLLLFLAIFVARQRVASVQPPVRGRGVIVRTVTFDGRQYRYAYKAWQAVALSGFIGLISSLFGVGGGVIHVPAMISLLHIPVHFAVATSQFILAFMAGGGTIVHLLDGSLAGKALAQAAFLGLGAVPGAQVGARIARRTRGRSILIMLAGALVLLAIRLIVKSVADL